jgi:hypothetical protein
MKKLAGYWLSTLQQAFHNPISRPFIIYDERVVGSSYDGRQTVLRKLKLDETIQLCREPNNSYDSNAIRVERINGECFGYINRSLAAQLAPRMDAFIRTILGKVTRFSTMRNSYDILNAYITFEWPKGGEVYEQSEADF